MTKDEALKLALEFVENSEGGTADLEAHIKEALAQPEQEPVAWKETDEVECPVCRDKGFPWPKCGHITYLERTTPPQRTWVGLTDEEVKDIVWNLPYEPSQEHIRAIEAKLKEKNT